MKNGGKIKIVAFIIIVQYIYFRNICCLLNIFIDNINYININVYM